MFRRWRYSKMHCDVQDKKRMQADIPVHSLGVRATLRKVYVKYLFCGHGCQPQSQNIVASSAGRAATRTQSSAHLKGWLVLPSGTARLSNQA
jgi:hypothetical protein